MDKNELKDKVNKRINEGMESVFDIFENIFEGFQSNFDKVFKTEVNSKFKTETAEKDSAIDTTEIHSFKEFKDGQCVSSGKKVWKNGKLVCDEATANSIEDKSNCKCACTKETENCKCECAKDVERTVGDENSEQLKKKISVLETQVKNLIIENTNLKKQLDTIRSVFNK